MVSEIAAIVSLISCLINVGLFTAFVHIFLVGLKREPGGQRSVKPTNPAPQIHNSDYEDSVKVMDGVHEKQVENDLKNRSTL